MTHSNLFRSFSSGKRVTEDRCDFLFSTGEYTERDVRDDWGGLFDLIENHVEDEGEENIATRTASSGLVSGGKKKKKKKDKEATSASGGLGISGGGGKVIDSALDAVAVAVELAEDLLHNDKKTHEESVEEPMQRKISRAGSIPKDWESDSDSSKEEEENRISTHSRRRIRRHRRQRKGKLPAHLARKKDSLPPANLPVSPPPSGRSDSGRSPAGRGRRRKRRHGTRKRLRDSPDSRLREGVSARGSRR